MSVGHNGPETRRIRLGILSGELFDLRLGKRGGFGKNARTVAAFFRDRPELGVDVVFLHGWGQAPAHDFLWELDGLPLIRCPEISGPRLRRWFAYRSLLRRHRIDLLLTVDYHPSYKWVLYALSGTPTVVWARDPRTPEDWANIDTLRIPGVEGRPPDSLPFDARDFRRVFRVWRMLAGRLVVAAPDPFVASKVAPTYGVHLPKVCHLPTLLDLAPVPVRKSSRPRVLFLGRLDPIKRPWVFWRLAERLPEVEFICLGASHFPYPAHRWWPTPTPPNLQWLGHVDGHAKAELLASAWVLVNTSIHEAVPTSFLEALRCETPIVSCQDAGGIVSRFGIYVGRFPGDGLAAVPHLERALLGLIRDERRRTDLGRQGRAWVESACSPDRFLTEWYALLRELGVWHTHEPAEQRSQPGLGAKESRT